jgi:hypothetical protein
MDAEDAGAAGGDWETPAAPASSRSAPKGIDARAAKLHAAALGSEPPSPPCAAGVLAAAVERFPSVAGGWSRGANS